MNGLDRSGYIGNDISQHNIQPEFLASFGLVIDQFLRQFGNLTHSLYLYGSVGRGTAVPYESDLDISVILHQTPNEDDLSKMSYLGRALQQQCPIFSKVEFDVGDYDAVMRHNEFEWRFWLKHCCVNVHGEDLRAKIELYRPSIHIGLAINQDLEARYQTAMSQLTTQWDGSIAKSIAKKLLRCDYALLVAQDQSWHVDLNSMAQTLQRYLPVADIGSILKLAQSTDMPAYVGIENLRRYGQQVIHRYKRAAIAYT